MRVEKMTKRLLSSLLIMAMVFGSMTGGMPKQVQAAVNQEKLTSAAQQVNSLSDSSCMNASEKYLYLGS